MAMSTTALIAFSEIADEDRDDRAFEERIVLRQCASTANDVIVTLVTATSYLMASYALGASLKSLGTRTRMVCLMTRELADDADVRLNMTLAGFHEIMVVNRIANPARRLKLVPNAWFKAGDEHTRR
jgi:hypothetical protein